MYDCIILGGGPAGLTAGLYLARGGKKAVIIEKTAFGGQLNLAGKIENMPGSPNVEAYLLADSIKSQAKESGVEIITATPKGYDFNGDIKTVNTDKGEIKSKNVIIATGARHKPLGLVEEEKYIGSGMSYCAHCDGFFFKGKDVVVVGGGDTALTSALHLANICNKVYLVHRREVMRGAKKYVDELRQKDNVKFILNAQISKILGEFAVEKVLLKTAKDDLILPVSGVFSCIGILPNSEEFDVKKDDFGAIVVDENMRTSIKGVYAVGDVRATVLRQIITACADGAIAANDVINNG